MKTADSSASILLLCFFSSLPTYRSIVGALVCCCDMCMLFGHCRSQGRRLWTTWCGPYFGWSEEVVELSCSGMCEDTCAVSTHRHSIQCVRARVCACA